MPTLPSYACPVENSEKLRRERQTNKKTFRQVKNTPTGTKKKEHEKQNKILEDGRRWQ